MNNFFIAQDPYTRVANKGIIYKIVKKVLQKLKIGDLKSPIFNPMVDMTNIEQRINYFHLMNRVVEQGVDGDVVELGTFTGSCAMLFQNVIQQSKSDKILHVFDSFETQFTESGDIQQKLIANFKKASLKLPVMHKGYFNETLPSGLPEKIAFAHLDCGFGGDKFEHKEILLFCLNQVYPKLSKGAICVLMDYQDIEGIIGGHDVNPGVKLATDEFLKDKPEKMVGLYGNQCSHGYFIKN
ncbi:MAG: hypothetical protein EOP00_01670 [Pedobacter sp.]|nr:MAG: hypothetical protein EOP00_01670 [Pedobacter sp.]